MNMFFAICYLIAVVLFLAGAFGFWERPKVNLISLGLFFFALPSLIQAFQGV